LSDQLNNNTDDVDDDEENDSPLDIDDNELSTYFIPPPGQGVDTPPVVRSLASTPKLFPTRHEKTFDLGSLNLHS
jgi:hypothetical protein